MQTIKKVDVSVMLQELQENKYLSEEQIGMLFLTLLKKLLSQNISFSTIEISFSSTQLQQFLYFLSLTIDKYSFYKQALDICLQQNEENGNLLGKYIEKYEGGVYE